MATVPDAAMHARLILEVQGESAYASMPPADAVRDCLEAAVRRAYAGSVAELELAVRVVDTVEGRALNRQYRQQDKATNVLAFPAAADLSPHEIAKPLGDIVICGPVVEREAAEQGKNAASHWIHLLVHGALHLLGYDHATAGEAAVMESLEVELLAEQGISDPYSGQ